MIETVEPLLVHIDDAARILGLGRSAFYVLVAQGRIEKVKVGRRSLVPLASLKAFTNSLSKAAD